MWAKDPDIVSLPSMAKHVLSQSMSEKIVNYVIQYNKIILSMIYVHVTVYNASKRADYRTSSFECMKGIQLYYLYNSHAEWKW